VNDMDLLAGFRANVPEAPVSPQAEARFQEAIQRSQRRRPFHRATSLSRRGRLAIIAPVAAGAAAAIALALLPGGTAPAPALTVTLLADQAAAAALRQPSVSPGQWVFREIKYKMGQSPLWNPASHGDTTDTWETADGIRGDDMGPLPLFVLGSSVPGSVPYADLGSLPSNPAALERYLADRQAYMSWASPSKRAFDSIESIFAQYVVPPKLAAELYRALADIPGVTVNAHVRDIAGRPGVAFALPGGWLSEIILNPTSDMFMGLQGRFGVVKAEPKGHTTPVTWVTYQLALIREAFVSGNGVLP
jgi:hypothetical protein